MWIFYCGRGGINSLKSSLKKNKNKNRIWRDTSFFMFYLEIYSSHNPLWIMHFLFVKAHLIFIISSSVEVVPETPSDFRIHREYNRLLYPGALAWEMMKTSLSFFFFQEPSIYTSSLHPSVHQELMFCLSQLTYKLEQYFLVKIKLSKIIP